MTHAGASNRVAAAAGGCDALPASGVITAARSTVLTPETRARAAAVADGIRNDGAAVAATLLLDAASRTMAIRS